MTTRSVWTGKQASKVVKVRLPIVDRFGRRDGEREFQVEPEHERALRTYVGQVNRWAAPVLLAVLLLLVVALGGAVLAATTHARTGVALSGFATLALGSLAWLFPFATPETVAAIGIEPARRLARAGGVVLIVMGTAMLLSAWRLVP